MIRPDATFTVRRLTARSLVSDWAEAGWFLVHEGALWSIVGFTLFPGNVVEFMLARTDTYAEGCEHVPVAGETVVTVLVQQKQDDKTGTGKTSKVVLADAEKIAHRYAEDGAEASASQSFWSTLEHMLKLAWTAIDTDQT